MAAARRKVDLLQFMLAALQQQQEVEEKQQQRQQQEQKQLQAVNGGSVAVATLTTTVTAAAVSNGRQDLGAQIQQLKGQLVVAQVRGWGEETECLGLRV